MDAQNIEPVAAAIAYIEAHLGGKLDLDTVAGAVCYSKYHLHRMFTGTAGMTPRSYIQRRRLTEAARLLVCSRRPALDIALDAGYESHQGFAAVFKAMYKQTPAEYRAGQTFYPLQLALALNRSPSLSGSGWAITYAVPDDLPDWMEFLALTVDGFPRLDAALHRARMERYIRHRQALVMRDGAAVIGAAAFSVRTGSIDFLAVHPQYRRNGVEEALLDFMIRSRFGGRELSITTFRAGDRADTGQRAAYRRLGFTEAELLTEFGYPTQRLVLPPGRRGSGNG